MYEGFYQEPVEDNFSGIVSQKKNLICVRDRLLEFVKIVYSNISVERLSDRSLYIYCSKNSKIDYIPCY